LNVEQIPSLKESFQCSKIYKFANIGSLFNKSHLHVIEFEIIDSISTIPSEKNIYASFSKHKLSLLSEMPNETKAFIEYLNSKIFISILEEITGIPGLHGDPDLQGGGIHAIGVGGYLKLHTDFNWQKKIKMHRRLNLLIYLNSNWRDEWQGAIELWDENAKEKIIQFNPELGNAVIFETTDSSYHGHPEPLQCPVGEYRKSIAMYYYTVDRPEDEIVFGKSEMTNYIERPGEHFNSDKFRRLRHSLQLGLKKILFNIRKLFHG